MYDTIVPLLRCTTCHQELRVYTVGEAGASGEIAEGAVACPAGHSWPVEGGVLVFTREDARSDPWSRSYAEYEEYHNGSYRVPRVRGTGDG